ncbi:MAG: SAM-dependent DNA methyltransferase, partial [Synergistaceae bacterium]|nr:SAM-dependent DNA methyltransferase [Synergistaceae bacterium]
FVEFQKRVSLDHTSFIDVYIPSTKTIIEQKSYGVNLNKEYQQSDGESLTPYQQAKRYSNNLPYSEQARWIIVCDFGTLLIYDMERPRANPEIIYLKDLPGSLHKLRFLVDSKAPSPVDIREEEISVKAGELIGRLYDSLLKRYDPDDENALASLNVFCVRLVFILYAEDAGLFEKGQFHNYLSKHRSMAHEAVRQLFTVLSQSEEERERYLEDDLKAFRYVNGGLFDKQNIEFPQIDGEPLEIILKDMAEGFDWSRISPTIFGAIFESTLNPETRYQEGMHYTAPEIIHKVIDPLFLDGLNETLNAILSEPQSFERTEKLLAFRKKLASLRFLDPACGSGNFLTESFISLRRIENKIIDALPENERASAKVLVSITQFHGIEAHDFAVNVAKTALWISDHQMWKETQNITHSRESHLPLVDYHHIKHGSAMDTLENLGWKEPGWKISHDDMLYIMGNPPFLGYSQQNKGQKESVRNFYGKAKADYVSCWFWIASEYVQDKNTKAAFIATNSITQGEQVAYVFKPLSERWGIKIDFAHQSFVWDSESKYKAHVHVVVIGFSTNPPELKRLYTPDGMRLVNNINFYLAEGPDEDIAVPRACPICSNAPSMTAGNRAADGGHLIIEGEDYKGFIRQEPKAKKYIKRYMMGNEFINNIKRYCLWLVEATPQEIHDMPLVRKRVNLCRKDRLKGAPDRQKLANTPHLFRETQNPESYIAIPLVSSERRCYIPIGWLDDSVIPGNNLMIIPDATLYDFGILTSRVSMAWMRRVGGRLKSDYRYTKENVYNTFVWPEPS